MARNINLSQQPEMVRLAAHAIGLDQMRPYVRHGKTYYRPYRNRYHTHDKSSVYNVWRDLCAKGYAVCNEGQISGNHHYYYFNLTRAGLDWLGETLKITIYDEED